jgi:antitoxin YefM
MALAAISATEARREFFDLVKGVTQKNKIFHIHHKTGNIILMLEEDYDNLLETLELLSTPGLKESLQRSMKQVEKGQTISMQEAFGE